jgi:uncharacterized lipoprotein YajG
MTAVSEQELLLERGLVLVPDSRQQEDMTAVSEQGRLLELVPVPDVQQLECLLESLWLQLLVQAFLLLRHFYCLS